MRSDDAVSYRYRINSGSWSGLYLITEPIEITGFTEGDYTLEVAGVDIAGNDQRESTPAGCSWTIDMTAPEAELTGLPDTVTSDNTLNASVTGSDVVAWKYCLDRGSWSAESTSGITMADLAEGAHSLAVIGRDQAGNWQSMSESEAYCWVIDRTPPVAVAENMPRKVSSTLDISMTITGAGVRYYMYNLDDTGWSEPIDVSVLLVKTGLTETSHEILLRGIDEAGNIQSVDDATSITWTIDTTVPEAILNPAPSGTYATDSINCTVSENGSVEVVAYKYAVDSASWSSSIDVSEPLVVSGLSDETHTIRIRGMSSEGYWQSEESATEYTWTVDTTPPRAELEDVPYEVTNSTTTSITVCGSGVYAYKYVIDQSSPDWSGLTEYPASDSISETLAEGYHTITVIARDAAGNWQDGGDATTFSWTIDISTALAEFITRTLPSNPTNSRSADISVGPPSLVSYRYKLDNGDWSGDYSIESHIILSNILSNGEHTLRLVGKDLYGNIQSVDNATVYTWEVDTDKPVCELQQCPASLTPLKTAEIVVTGTKVVSYRYRLDSGDWCDETDISENIVLSSLDEGYHRIYVIGKSAVGNWQSLSSPTTYGWYVDSQAPSVELSGVPDEKTSSTDLRITVGGLGVAAYKYALDDVSPVWGDIEERPVTSPILHSGLSRTDHSLLVIARDSAGNWQETPRVCEWEITPLVPPAVNDGGEGINYDTDLLIAFNWTPPDGTADVRIQVSSDENFTNVLFDSVIGIVSRYDYLVTESDGARYYARVMVMSADNIWSNWGDPSDGIDLAGSITGMVRDTQPSPIADATVALFNTDDDLSAYDPETMTNPEPLATVQTDTSGIFLFPNVTIGEKAYKIVVSKNQRYAVKESLTVTVGEKCDTGVITLVTDYTGTGTIEGYVSDANDASIIIGATIQVYDWKHALVNETVSTEDDNQAVFSISAIPAGTYTVVVSKDGYYPLEISGIPVNQGTIEMGMQALCEILLEPQVRFVLLWGETPYDLDLHIVGPASNDNVTSRFMVYYGNESYNVGTNTSIDEGDTEGVFATTSLVQDIYPGNGFYGYGPEAINLYRLVNVQYARGVYCLTIRNYSLYSNATNHDTAWDSSLTSITMRIYDSGGLYREINFPSDSSLWTGTSGDSYDSWKVVKMTVRGTGRKNRSFKVINEFYETSSTSTTVFDW